MNPITPISSFHHVAISAQDISLSVAFYERLGFAVLVTWSDPTGNLVIKHLALGTFVLEIFSYRDGADGGLSSRNLADDLKIRGVRHIGLRVSDVQRAHADVITAGLEPLAPVQHGRTGIDYFFMRDPDGIFVEFVQDDRDLL
jgi:catechol 2,3-dioxygenase-like lactoylglutathione lyase family enzyme